MITCGKTKLVNAVPEIVKIIDKTDASFFYHERKKLSPSTSRSSGFLRDIACLESLFPGKIHRLGPAEQNHNHIYFSLNSKGRQKYSTTIELQMHEFDQNLNAIFSKQHSNNVSRAEKLSGLSSLYPDMNRDGFLFSPCGFSLNAISGPSYFTVHVTPQAKGSYASVETNLVEKNYDEIIEKVITVFSPRKFSAVLTTSVDKNSSCLHKTASDHLNGYELIGKDHYEFECGLAATFLNLAKSDEAESRKQE
jgi:S-adenosylmethionine decarboxylase